MAPHPQFPGLEHLSFGDISRLTYKEQAVWFLNGFWDADKGNLSQHAERVWSWHKLFSQLDTHAATPRGADGSELDQILSAKFLEQTEQTLTSLERKAALKEIDVNNDGKMALVEYLMYVFRKQAAEVADAQQGKAQEVQACQDIIDSCLAMLPEIEANLAAQKEARREVAAALAGAKSARAEAEAALTVQIEAEAAVREALSLVEAARGELQRAVDECRRQEQAREDEMARLQGVLGDASTGIVSKGRAANQLHELRNNDPLPLRKAKLTQEAALRVMEKRERAAASKHAEAAAKTATCRTKFDDLQAKEVELEARRHELEVAVAELEASYAEMQSRMGEASAAIEELKKQMCGLGAVWWMERELYEADESLPRAKQRFDHSKPFHFEAHNEFAAEATAAETAVLAPARGASKAKAISSSRGGAEELAAMVSG